MNVVELTSAPPSLEERRVAALEREAEAAERPAAAMERTATLLHRDLLGDLCLLTKEDLCEAIGCRPTKLDELIADGDVPAFHVGAHVRAHPDAVRAVLRRWADGHAPG